MASCKENETAPKKPVNDTLSFSKSYEVKVIDSCEYIYVSEQAQFSIAHKGDCKYCLQRDIEFCETQEEEY